jgi:hypothetical protein
MLNCQIEKFISHILKEDAMRIRTVKFQATRTWGYA